LIGGDGGGSKISMFLSLGGGGYENRRLQGWRLINFQFLFCCRRWQLEKSIFFSGSRQRWLSRSAYTSRYNSKNNLISRKQVENVM
jgi:hypothetical protein